MKGAEEEHTAGPTACSLFLQGLASWGVLQASSLYPHLPRLVYADLYLMHQPLAESQLEEDREMGQDAA